MIDLQKIKSDYFVDYEDNNKITVKSKKFRKDRSSSFTIYIEHNKINTDYIYNVKIAFSREFSDGWRLLRENSESIKNSLERIFKDNNFHPSINTGNNISIYGQRIVNENNAKLFNKEIINTIYQLSDLFYEKFYTNPLLEQLKKNKFIERKIDKNLNNSNIFDFDPNERDRQTKKHKELENSLAVILKENNIEPFDPDDVNAKFDIGWESHKNIIICEVKSTKNNEITQIRLGLGQVLHYVFLLKEKYGIEKKIIPFLFVEMKPKDENIIEFCKDSKVLISWPENGIPKELL